MLRYTLFAFVLVLIKPNANAQNLIWGNEQTIGIPDGQALRPRITIASDGPVVAWGDMPNSLYASVYNGSSFSMPLIVQPIGVNPWVATWAGADVTAHGDTVIVVYSTGDQGVGTLYASRSIDGGLSWPDTMRIAPLPGLEARFPTVDYVPGQGPVVQYMQFETNWADPRYVVRRSMDGGTTYSEPVAVSAPYAPGEVCDCCTGQIIAGDGGVAALFRNNDSNTRTIWAATSSDGGVTFPAGGEVDQTNWVFNACPSSGPDGYIAGDSIRYVWMSRATNGSKCYYGSAARSDLSVGVNGLVHSGQASALTQNFPRIAGSGDTLGIVWEQNLQGSKEIMFRWSVNGWAGLSVADTANVITTGVQSTPDIAFYNGTFHLVWQDDASGQLHYRDAVIVNDVSVTELNGANNTLGLWPSPAIEQLNISLPNGTAFIEIMDVRGRIVLRSGPTNKLTVSVLEQGTYSVRCLSKQNTVLGTGRFVK